MKGPPPNQTRRIIRIGGSYYVSLPRVYMRQVGGYRGQEVRLQIQHDAIVVHLIRTQKWGTMK